MTGSGINNGEPGVAHRLTNRDRRGPQRNKFVGKVNPKAARSSPRAPESREGESHRSAALFGPAISGCVPMMRFFPSTRTTFGGGASSGRAARW